MPDRPPLKMAVLISGTGRTLKNFLDLIDAGRLNARVVTVIANTARASGLQYGEKAGIPVAVVRPGDYPGQDAFSEAVFARCRRAGAELAALAGFLKRLTIPADFANRVTNIHPALIPSFCGEGFYGHHVHEAVLAYGVKLSGCTVHFCDNQYDHGPVILQKAVPVLDDDTPDALAARVFEAETEAYPEALALIAAGRVRVEGRRARVLPE